jgi:hypothetical protein
MNIFSLAILGRGVGGMPFQPRDNRGQALLEFALVLPILLLLVFGIIEFGLIFFDNLVITQAAREGARVGVVGGSDAEIMETVEYSAGSLDLSLLQIGIEPDQTERSQGDPLKVEVHYNVPIMTPIMGQLLPNPYPLHAVVTMRME